MGLLRILVFLSSSLFFLTAPSFSFFFRKINLVQHQRLISPPTFKMQRISNALESLFHQLPFAGNKKSFGEPVVMGDESIMSPKKHGTSNTPVQQNLRWDADRKTADR
jgi:hypothetical protein